MTSEHPQNHEAPRRRWFQFELTTVLVLVAILAWAMSYYPFPNKMDAVAAMVHEITSYRIGDDGLYDPQLPGPEPLTGYWGLDHYNWFWRLKLTVEELLLPVSALVVFLAWKTVWVIVAPRLRRLLPMGGRASYDWLTDRVRLIGLGIALAAVLILTLVYLLDS